MDTIKYTETTHKQTTNIMKKIISIIIIIIISTILSAH